MLYNIYKEKKGTYFNWREETKFSSGMCKYILNIYLNMELVEFKNNSETILCMFRKCLSDFNRNNLL